jgi:hypothetical protein
MVRPSHPLRLVYSNYTWRRLQITKFLVMQFSPFSRHLNIELASFKHRTIYIQRKPTGSNTKTPRGRH